jgi:hypothetical protein
METVSNFLDKLKKTGEQDGSPLDHTMVFFSSNLGNASNHATKNLPVLLAGGAFDLRPLRKRPLPFLRRPRLHSELRRLSAKPRRQKRQRDRYEAAKPRQRSAPISPAKGAQLLGVEHLATVASPCIRVKSKFRRRFVKALRRSAWEQRSARGRVSQAPRSYIPV